MAKRWLKNAKCDNGLVQQLQTSHGVVIKLEMDWCGIGQLHVAMLLQLPCFLVELVSVGVTAAVLQANIDRKLVFLKGGGWVTFSQIFTKKGMSCSVR